MEMRATEQAGNAGERTTTMQHRITYLSSWDVGLSNLSLGAFRRRILSKEEARSMIGSASASGHLACVAKDDLGAPYCERERERHTQLCAALREHADVEVRLQDFFGRDCATPLCAAEVGEHKDLLVVDCAYVVDMKSSVEAVPADGSGSAGSFEERVRRLRTNPLGMTSRQTPSISTCSN